MPHKAQALPKSSPAESNTVRVKPCWSQALLESIKFPDYVEIKKIICPIRVKPHRESIKCPYGVKRKIYVCPIGVKPCRESIKCSDSVKSIKCPDGVEIKRNVCPVGVKPCRESINVTVLR